MTRKELLHKIQQISFTVDDTVLFLDTHPSDRQALAYYYKQLALLDELERQYVEQFGPLSDRQAAGQTKWTWPDTPAPWMREE